MNCYCVCHNPISSCATCEHCKGVNEVTVHALRGLVGTLDGLLLKYGQHLAECDIFWSFNEGECDCGLDAALEDLKGFRIGEKDGDLPQN